MRAGALVVVAVVASCGGPAQAPVPPPASAPARVAPAPTASPVPATVAVAPSQAGRPAFLSVRLTDVRTGEQFTLGGFQGKVVLGIAMAVW